MKFAKAQKHQVKLKLAFVGPAGSGKTYSALSVGCSLAKLVGTQVAVIDTERGSASLYADVFDFDVLELESFSPLAYVEAIKTAEREGYGVIIVDSLSHAWTGRDGALEQVDRAAKREQGNSFSAWRHVTPHHNAMVDALVSSTSHLIATMRVKTEYVLETNSKGKQVPRKVGLAPIQRDGLEYEFSVVGDLDIDNGFTVTKTRCSILAGQYIERPGAKIAEQLITWLRSGAPESERPPAQGPSAETVAAGSTSALELVLESIANAPHEAALHAISRQAAAFVGADRDAARSAWARRRDELRAAAAPTEDEVEAAVVEAVGVPAPAEPSGSGPQSNAEPETVRLPDTAPHRGNAAARAVVGRAIGGGGRP